MSLLQPPAHISLCSKGPELELGHLVAPGPWYLRGGGKKKKRKEEEHELDKYDQLPGTCLKPPAAVVDIRKLRSLGDARKFYCLAPTRNARLPFQLPGAPRHFSPVTGKTGHRFSPPGLEPQKNLFTENDGSGVMFSQATSL